MSSLKVVGERVINTTLRENEEPVIEKNSSRASSANRSTSSLFAWTSRSLNRPIAPINNCAVVNDKGLPAFYCVHSVSGVAGTDFLDMADRLESVVRFYGIQAPPKLMPDANFGNSVDALAKFYADALIDFQPTGPFMLGGYCIGAVVALAIANNLRSRGREVGPLIAIDGVPENTKFELRRRQPSYWVDLARNLRGWLSHADLMRSFTPQALMWSISNNVSAIGRGLLGLNKAQRVGGGYAVDSIMDVSRFSATHIEFINRLMGALFAYVPQSYAGEVIVYEASVKPLLHLPQIGRIWGKLAAKTVVIDVVGTHISMIHEPYVDALAVDLKQRITEFFSTRPVVSYQSDALHAADA